MNKLQKYILFLTAGILPAVSIYGQNDTLNQPDQRREAEKVKKIAIGTSLVYATGLIGLNSLWYSNVEQSKLHSFNDNNEWLQIDKVGHGYSAYTLTKLSYHIYPSNYSSKKRILYSGASSFAFLTTIEIFDGFSEEWGFSWGDFIANTSGIGLFTAQELLFNKQIAQLKYSYHNTEYSDLRPNTLGENTLQKAFKDYNGQTYWLSLNLNSIHQHFPLEWLNIAFGYGGTNMIFAPNEPAIIGNRLFTPQREFYLSLDVDWSKVKTQNEYVRWLLRIANCIKIPAPTIRFKKGGEPIFYGLYF